MDFIAIDLETTGTLPYVDRIVEIAAVSFKKGRAVSFFEQLVDPKILIPQEASRINGITNDMVRGRPPIEEVLGPFAEFCGSEILTAHNATFDFQFLKSAIEKHKSPAPGGPLLDTYSLAKKLIPGMANYKLSTLISYLKIDSSNLHRAKQDALCCGKLFYYLISKLKAEDYRVIAKAGGRAPLRFPQITHHHQMDWLMG